MRRHPVSHGFASPPRSPAAGLAAFPVVALAGFIALAALPIAPAHAAPTQPQTFHLMNITKIMAGYQGNTNIQAVEMKMLAGGENLVGTATITIYDTNGVKVADLGTFPGSLPNGTTGDRVLCATAAFQSAFGIVPDLVITPGIPLPSGQVVFEKTTCRVNAIPYGAVAVPLTGPTAAPTIPTLGATALVRTVDDATAPSCPLAENAAARFTLQSGTSLGNPLVFQNNLRDTTQVWSTVTAVAGTPPSRPAGIRFSPNPFTSATVMEFPGGPGQVSIIDVRGRTVRTWEGLRWTQPGEERYRLPWDGTDRSGRPVAQGIYYVRADGAREVWAGRLLVLR